MSLGIQHLSKSLKPETSGILWLTDEKLSYNSHGAYEFNYLLDGMLVKSLANEEKVDKKSHFFLGENFGKPFFIGHVLVDNKDDIKLMYNHFELASSFLHPDAMIYIFNKSKNTANTNILKILGQKFKDYSFENLNI